MILRQVWPVVLLPLTVAYVNWVVVPLEQRKLEEVFGDVWGRAARPAGARRPPGTEWQRADEMGEVPG